MTTQEPDGPCIDILSLPDISVAEMDFRDTAFFQSTGLVPPQLPTPAEIVELFPHLKDGGRGIAKFEDLNLIIKAGDSDYLSLEEAQILRAIKKAFPANEVPVPELVGWRKVGTQNFIYMSLMPGQTLRDTWPSLTTTDKTSIRDQLARIVTALRRIRQSSPNRFIGSISGGPVQDRFFKLDYEEGPFYSIKTFNDWVGATATRQKPSSEGFKKDIYRDYLPDTGEIYFTHGDLTLTNIIISGPPGSKQIVGIIDWEQAGWYPEYWEYCKLLYGVDYEHEWREGGWADEVMQPFEDQYEAFGEYSTWRGCP